MEVIAFEYQFIVEGYITFTIRVKSGEFAGASNFCILDTSLKDAILSLGKMYNNLKGTYQMNDYDSDDFILFECLNLGHIRISGQVGGSFNQQYLKYQFITDQTVLNSLISSFQSVVT